MSKNSVVYFQGCRGVGGAAMFRQLWTDGCGNQFGGPGKQWKAQHPSAECPGKVNVIEGMRDGLDAVIFAVPASGAISDAS